MSNETLHKALTTPSETRKLLSKTQEYFRHSGLLSPEQGIRIYLNNRITTMREWLEEDFPTSTAIPKALLEKYELIPFKKLLMMFLQNGTSESPLRTRAGEEFLIYCFTLNLSAIQQELLAADFFVSQAMNAFNEAHFEQVLASLQPLASKLKLPNNTLSKKLFNVTLKHNLSSFFTEEDHRINEPCSMELTVVKSKVVVQFLGVHK